MGYILQSLEFLGQESDLLFQDGWFKWKLDQQVGIKVGAKSCSGTRFFGQLLVQLPKIGTKVWSEVSRKSSLALNKHGE